MAALAGSSFFYLVVTLHVLHYRLYVGGRKGCVFKFDDKPYEIWLKKINFFAVHAPVVFLSLLVARSPVVRENAWAHHLIGCVLTWVIWDGGDVSHDLDIQTKMLIM